MPSVTAIVATRDRPEMAAEAVRSILAQTRPPEEIIVADDGDGRTAAALAARYGVQTTQSWKRGPAAARNAAASLAGGDWLAFCDDDDTWLPTRLEKQLAVADADTVLVFADADRSDGRRESAGRKPAAGSVFRRLLLDNWIPTSTVLLRRDAFERAGGFHPRFSPAEDYDLWLRVSRLGQVRFFAEPLATYRIHAGQLQNQQLEMIGATVATVENAWREGRREYHRPAGLSGRLRRLHFLHGRLLAHHGFPAAARRAYLRAWRYAWFYPPAPLFWLLSFIGI
ncbi:MAG: glycosyltransferase [Myxococcales bacterium]|nr:glycosyltransferase [Myxococcales bacterium]